MLSVRAMVNSGLDACVVMARGLVWSGLVKAVEGWSVIFWGTRPLSGGRRDGRSGLRRWSERGDGSDKLSKYGRTAREPPTLAETIGRGRADHHGQHPIRSK